MILLMEQQDLVFSEQRKVYSVTEIISDVKAEMERSFREVWIEGEISNLRKPSSGHLYFTLKDSEAQISAVCFRMRSRYLKFSPEDGMDVLARGMVTVYPPRGQLQLLVVFMEPLGRGALQAAFEQLKARLEAEGLFDQSHKKKLPLLPSKIGVVTSRTGAAIQDILRVLKRRNDRLNVLVVPVRVQGDSAAAEIAEGIQQLNRRDDIDVIVVGRGGGSLEDLWAFNEEIVARAIFDSRIPVISAVGHEIDFTISDFVADLRAPTPSAAAEIVSGKREDLIAGLAEFNRRLRQVVSYLLQRKRERLSRLERSRGFVDAESRLRLYLQRLDELRIRLQKTLPVILDPLRRETVQLERQLLQQIHFLVQSRRQDSLALNQQLKAYSPLEVLERGYAIVSKPGEEIVRDPGQVAEGEQVNIRVSRGTFRARREEGNGV
jgi:exodeoxyribonuclease VII large subunit